ncbi:Uncharacterised protein [Rothia kristinae]|nr:Uncharacterised protein [Rothia kristinae]
MSPARGRERGGRSTPSGVEVQVCCGLQTVPWQCRTRAEAAPAAPCRRRGGCRSRHRVRAAPRVRRHPGAEPPGGGARRRGTARAAVPDGPLRGAHPAPGPARQRDDGHHGSQREARAQDHRGHRVHLVRRRRLPVHRGPVRPARAVAARGDHGRHHPRRPAAGGGRVHLPGLGAPGLLRLRADRRAAVGRRGLRGGTADADAAAEPSSTSSSAGAGSAAVAAGSDSAAGASETVASGAEDRPAEKAEVLGVPAAQESRDGADAETPRTDAAESAVSGSAQTPASVSDGSAAPEAAASASAEHAAAGTRRRPGPRPPPPSTPPPGTRRRPGRSRADRVHRSG